MRRNRHHHAIQHQKRVLEQVVTVTDVKTVTIVTFETVTTGVTGMSETVNLRRADHDSRSIQRAPATANISLDAPSPALHDWRRADETASALSARGQNSGRF